jgi:hypothetical protein
VDLEVPCRATSVDFASILLKEKVTPVVYTDLRCFHITRIFFIAVSHPPTTYNERLNDP